MQRRDFVFGVASALTLSWLSAGCRGSQYAHVLDPNEKDLVGSHAAGAETWDPLIQTAVGQLLGRQIDEIRPVVHQDMPPLKKRICFVGVENATIEEIGDAKAQISEKIDACIAGSDMFEIINQRYVEAGLRQCAMQPDDLYIPEKRRKFIATMEQLEQPFDYLLYAKITSLTTKSNKDTQRDYMLTLELVHMETGHSDKESAKLRKGYHKSRLAAKRAY